MAGGLGSGGVASVACPGSRAAGGRGPGQSWEQAEAREGAGPSAALRCGFYSSRLRAELGGGDSLMKREVGLSLEEMGRAAWPGGEDQPWPGQVGKGAPGLTRP